MVEFFFCADKGVYGCNGEEKDNPQCIYVPEMGIPQVKVEKMSGVAGLQVFLQEPFTPDSLGAEFFDACLPVFVSFAVFHSHWYRTNYEQVRQ